MLKKGQISTEYLIVVGFVVFLVLVVLGIAFFYTSVTNDQIKISQITNLADKIISSAESVFYSGEPSKLTITGYLPMGITRFEIRSNEIIIGVLTGSGVTTMSFSSNVPLDDVNGDISMQEGVKRIEILAQEDVLAHKNDVLIHEV